MTSDHTRWIFSISVEIRYTEANPADDASKGLAVDSLIKKNRWIRGPNFLWEQESRWPAQPTTVREIPVEDPEIKREIRTFSAVSDAGANSLNKLLEKLSSWTRLKKIVAGSYAIETD